MIKIVQPNYEKAIVSIMDKEYEINGYQNIGKTFHHDIVSIKEYNDIYEVNKIIKTQINNVFIPGILQINSKYKFGFNKKGMPLYRFIPFDWRYPDFMVASKLKGKNRYAVIKFMKWEEKFPQGQLLHICEDFNYELFLYKYQFPIKTLSLKLNNDFDVFLLKKNHSDYRHLDVFSVDPLGSLDIDDAFSLENLGKNRYKIGIHIADVSTFLDHFDLWDEVEKRVSSIYLPNKVINMIPDILANNLCSLREGKDRLAFTLWIITNVHEVLEYKVEKTIIKNRKQYDYHDISLVHHPLFSLSRKITKNLFNKDVENWSTHQMVETLMILCNHLISLLLKDNDKLIYRIHQRSIIEDENSDIPIELKPILKILNSNSAEYSYDYIGHQSLDLTSYTHFTSPIRRYIDCYIHKLLTYQEVKKIDIDKINDFNKRTRKLERDINRQKLIEYVNYNEKLDAKVYIIQISENRFKITLYFPEWKIFYPYQLFDKIMQKIVTTNYDKVDKKYIYQYDDQRFYLKLYQKLDVTLTKTYDERNIRIVF